MGLMTMRSSGGRWKGALAVALICCLCLGIFALPQSAAAEKDYKHYTVKYMTIEGAEGVKLPAHVYVPVGEVPEGGFPAIVFIHSWCLNEFEYETKMQEFAKNGYITICYTCRGWYYAPGRNDVAGPLELKDLNNVVDWLIENTPVDENNIGSTGISYGGGHSLLALQFEPRIKTIVPMSGWTDLYDALAPYHTAKLGWSAFLLATGSTIAKPTSTMTDWLLSFLTDTKTDETLATLAERSAFTFIDEINARDPIPPMFMIQGINDDMFNSRQMVNFYEAYQGEKKLIMANGVHGSAEIPGLLYLPNSLWKDTRDWFDYHLKGIDNGIMDQKPVSIYQTWDKKQGLFDQWPVATGSYTLYPAEVVQNGKVSKRGSLNESAVAEEQTTTLKNTPLSMSATSGMFFLMPALRSYLDVYIKGTDPANFGKGSVAFESDKLTEDLTVLGTPRITLQTRTDKDIYQLNFFIYEVDKLGIARMVIHQSFSGWKSVPDALNNPEIQLNILSHKFKKGNKIRLVITTSDIVYALPALKNFSADLYWGGNTDTKLELPTI